MQTTVKACIEIDRPAEAIVAVILNPEMAVRWTSGLERFEVTSGRPGDVGSTARLHYREGDRTHVMEDRLLEVDPFRRYRSRVTGDMLSAEVETTLTPTAGGTRVDIRWTGAGKPLLLKLALPWMRASIARQASADLRKLKALVEAADG